MWMKSDIGKMDELFSCWKTSGMSDHWLWFNDRLDFPKKQMKYGLYLLCKF